MPDALIARGPRRATEPERGAYDPGRLRRAAQLAVKRLGPGQARVKGQDEPWYDVDLSADVPCYCKDAEFHGRGCKHELAVRLASGDMGLIQALGEMLNAAQQRNAALERQTKRRKVS